MTEAVQKADIAALRKEAQMFSKNIRRIQSGKDLYTVAQAYVKWLYMLDKRIYQQILGMQSGVKKDEDYATKTVREKVWTLVIERDLFTPHVATGKQDQLRISFSGEGYEVMRYNDVTKPVWDDMYTAFDRTRSAVYSKYTRLVRDAFNAIDEWLADKPDVLPSHLNASVLHHDGVAVSFLTSEETWTNEREEIQRQKTYLRSLSFVLDRYRKLGLGRIVNKLVYEYDLANNITGHAGEYQYGRVVSFSMEGNEPRVIAHEIGHHIYKVFLNDTQRKAWYDFIQHDLVSFSPADFAEIHKVYQQLYAEMLPRSSEYSYTVDGVWENISRHLTNPLTRQMFDAYSRQRSHVHMSPMKSSPEKAFEDFTEEPPFAMHVPTTYSNKNSEEAFCETISYFVCGKPLQPLIRHEFELITGLH